MSKNDDYQVIFGTSVLENTPKHVNNPLIVFPGQTVDSSNRFAIDEELMGRHILLLGGSGCGKTNAFCYTVSQLRENMSNSDIAIIFDTKGEFYDEFSKEGDYVIGNSFRFRDLSYTWNIFDEILIDGKDDNTVTINAKEISASLFRDRVSSTQPFFCNAAKDIFGGILMHFIRQADAKPNEWEERLNNKDLMNAFKSFTMNDYIKIFSHYSDMKFMLSYFGDGKSNQALGVFGELNNMLSEYFVGILAEHNPKRTIAMRKAVRNKGGKALFVEYDLSVGETLTPMYKLLIDQALKEALGRVASEGKVYLIADEFKLLPKLQHIDDALNFGRGLGVSVMAGIQSIDQLYDIYGKEKGAVLASGFGSIFAFHTNDSSSREYITNRFGTNVMNYGFYNIMENKRHVDKRDGNVVENWDQMNLGLGQAVIGLGYEPPFLFHFEKYGK